MVLIAPAVDMTKDLMWDEMSAAEKRRIKKHGRLERPSEYSAQPDVITLGLIEDGEASLR